MARVTQVTERSPMLSAERSRSAVLASAFVRGTFAAGLGLGAITVLVMVLWISSSSPDSGPGGALHVATGLWLLAHGAELVRTETLSGHPAPVATVPLLLTVLPLWLAYRAGRDSTESGGAEDPAGRRSAVGVCCAVSAGYLLVVLGVAAYARNSGLPADRASLAFPSAVLVVLVVAAGVWASRGRPWAPVLAWAPLRVQEAAARARFRAGLEAALRAAAAGVAMLLGGGALLVAVALVWHAGEVQESFLTLAGHWAGRICVLLLALAFVPNAAMWAASYGLGPGFALGTASTATPLTFGGHPALPDFPLLAAVPTQGPGTAANWASVAVPLAAGLVLARFTARAAVPVSGSREGAWGAGGTAAVAALAAAGCGAGAALLAAASGGALGTGALAEFGPVWWLVGPAALVWAAVIGVPAALLTRAWRLREQGWSWRRDVSSTEDERPEPAPDEGTGGKPRASGPLAERYDFLSAGSWHGEGARKARWASLRRGSGGLMADFPAGHTEARTDPRADLVADPRPDPRADLVADPRSDAVPVPQGPRPDPVPVPQDSPRNAASQDLPRDAVQDAEKTGDTSGNETESAGTGAGADTGTDTGTGTETGTGTSASRAENGGAGAEDGAGTGGGGTGTGRLPDAQGHAETGREDAP
ncbi:cell division protein PerM [Streptomyces halstedii]|uniref:cell division protein PerM n=1 Tax=Streptomyces halstedii TaxID=1944 RepID=UPI0037F7348C